jgi:hypothetical protein
MSLSWALNNPATRVAISVTRERCWYATMKQVRRAYDEVAENAKRHRIGLHISCNLYELQKNITPPL